MWGCVLLRSPAGAQIPVLIIIPWLGVLRELPLLPARGEIPALELLLLGIMTDCVLQHSCGWENTAWLQPAPVSSSLLQWEWEQGLLSMGHSKGTDSQLSILGCKKQHRSFNVGNQLQRRFQSSFQAQACPMGSMESSENHRMVWVGMD